MSEQQKDAILAAREMTAALNGMAARLDGAEERWGVRDAYLTAYGRRNRVLAWLAGAAAGIAIGLAVAVTILYVQVSDQQARITHNAATISQLHQTNVSACQAGNVTRANEIALWAHLIGESEAQSSARHENKAALERSEKVLGQFLDYVKRTFAAKDCARVYHIGG